MFASIKTVWTLLCGVGLLLVGNGFVVTSVTLRAHAHEFGPTAVAAVLAVFYIGVTVGAATTAPLIRRFGSVRVYLAMVAVIGACTLALALPPHPMSWVVFRGISGLAFGGLLVVVESWLNTSASLTTRGVVFGAYMIVVQLCLALGQLLIPLFSAGDGVAFVFAAGFYSLAALPVLLGRPSVPPHRSNASTPLRPAVAQAPAGVLACAMAGFVTGALLTLGPLYVVSSGHSVDDVAVFMLVLIASGLGLQFPLGRLADRIGRRPVLFGTSVAVCLVALVLAANPWSSLAILIAGGAVLGMFAFAIYPQAVAHAGDQVDPANMVGLSGVLLMAFGIGASLGPFALGVAMSSLGPEALFYGIAAGALTAAWVTGRSTTVPQPAATAPCSRSSCGGPELTLAAVHLPWLEPDVGAGGQNEEIPSVFDAGEIGPQERVDLVIDCE